MIVNTAKVVIPIVMKCSKNAGQPRNVKCRAKTQSYRA
jgi:hypothetical protein